jgi:hypothetical protein
MWGQNLPAIVKGGKYPHSLSLATSLAKKDFSFSFCCTSLSRSQYFALNSNCDRDRDELIN